MTTFDAPTVPLDVRFVYLLGPEVISMIGKRRPLNEAVPTMFEDLGMIRHPSVVSLFLEYIGKPMAKTLPIECPPASNDRLECMRWSMRWALVVASVSCGPILTQPDGGFVDAGANDANAPSDAQTDGSVTVGPTGGACKVAAPSVTTALAANAAVTATIHADVIACSTAADFTGTNFEAFPGWGADVAFGAFEKAAYTASGMRTFRYPGGEPGEWSDLLFTGKCTDNSSANWGSPAFADVWTFAQSAGVSTLMLQTNPTTQWCGAGNQDASGTHAAALVTAVSTQKINAVFEVGNEPEISAYFNANGGQAAYITKFIEHASAIHTAAPSAKVYGPVLCGLGGNCSFPTTWDSGWLAAFLQKTGDKATGNGKGTVDGISFHVYWHPEWAYSDFGEAKIDKYGFAQYWALTVMPYLRAQIAQYDSRDLPIAISEISIGNGIANDSAQTQNMFTVLETLDTIGAFAISGLRSFQWFDANAAGPTDFWMMTTSAARPIFYAFAAWSKMGPDMLSLDADASPHDLALYASRRGDGALVVLAINKTSSAHDVTLAFTGASVSGKPQATTTLAPATAGQDSSKSIIYAGATDPLPSALPTPASATATASPTISIPAFSAALVAFGP